MYERLDIAHVIATVDALHQRISTYFPGSGLSDVCSDLLGIAQRTAQRSLEIERPQYALRAAVMAAVALLVVVPIVTLILLHPENESVEAIEFVQVLEAGMNVVVLTGAAVISLITVETRVKRRRALEALHELRSLAHIVDMHQLTKDPAAIERPTTSRKDDVGRAATPELPRYLDFCCEMLSLTGKVAAIYVEHFQDSVVLDAANEIENLTTGLSRKIWQKLMIAQREQAAPARPKS